MRAFHALADNLVPLKGSKEQLEQTLIDHNGNCIFFTNESMIEDDMSRSSAIDSKSMAHTVVSIPFIPTLVKHTYYALAWQNTIAEMLNCSTMRRCAS